jgi:hypothetical protein
MVLYTPIYSGYIYIAMYSVLIIVITLIVLRLKFHGQVTLAIWLNNYAIHVRKLNFCLVPVH